MSTYDNLDIRHLKQRDKHALMKQIAEMVKDTQRYLIRELPNTITMTTKQYDLLQNDPNMLGAYDSNEHLFVTPHNAMEVVIKE